MAKKSILISLLTAPKNKCLRFYEGLVDGVEEGRQGSCTPDKCSTPDGQIGSACCRLDYNCFLLKDDLKCPVYIFRSIHPNCRNWPHNREELTKHGIKGCGYYWRNK